MLNSLLYEYNIFAQNSKLIKYYDLFLGLKTTATM